MKRIKVPINSIRDYIELFNGLFGLTESEIEVLTEFVRMNLSLENAGKGDVNTFSTDIKKRVAENLDRDNFNTLNTYIKRLKDKKAISPTNEGYEINRILIPTNDDKIEIHVQ